MANPRNHSPESLLRAHGQRVRLTHAEREQLELRVATFVANHPVRQETGDRLLTKRSSVSVFIQRFKPMPALIIAIALAVSGGVSYAAEDALPGDFLYPVKVSVNENVRSAIAVSDNAQAKLQAEFAGRRVSEEPIPVDVVR